MSYLKGFAIIANIDGAAQAAEDNCSLALTANTEDVSTKEDVAADGVLYPVNEVTYISGSLSVSGKLKTDANVLTLEVGKEVAVVFKAGDKGKTYSFTGTVSSLTYNADKSSNATYDYTVDSKGKITIA